MNAEREEHQQALHAHAFHVATLESKLKEERERAATALVRCSELEEGAGDDRNKLNIAKALTRTAQQDRERCDALTLEVRKQGLCRPTFTSLSTPSPRNFATTPI